jgi:enolase
MRIKDIFCIEVFDSRGEPTINVSVKIDSGFVGISEVPSGKSRGKDEASVVSFLQAKKNIKKLMPSLRSKNFSSIKSLDEFLIDFDGTKDKHILGGNLMIGISLATAKAVANSEKKELWEIIRNTYFKGGKIGTRRPMIFSNIINGGVHAQTDLSIQEYIAVAYPFDNPAQMVLRIISVYREVGNILKKNTGLKRLTIGDEGGYAIDFKDNEAPLKIINQAIKNLHFEKRFALAIDAAASEFFKDGKYDFEGKKKTKDEMLNIYSSYTRDIPSLISIEDPLDEEDYLGFGEACLKLPKIWIIGDDLTTTSYSKIDSYMKNKYITGAIIKPNQIGTLFETCEAIKAVKKYNGKVIISHRSGETVDTAIIHIAKASMIDALKIGAPARERLIKFNEYIRLFS